MKRIISVAVALVIGVASVSMADALADAKARRKERREAVEQLLKKGVAEEGAAGYLVVKKSAADDEGVVGVLKAENADRKIAYEAIAQKNGTSPEAVGKQAAEINKKKAAELR
ncbi:MAG: YdbL family protein [Kiritimatiellaeota bacterium]|nr:YdbL family protein [Kiritimatiellota bacterium]